MDAEKQSYNPIHLTHEVYLLLEEKGLPVKREGNLNAAIDGASEILRWLGLEPVIPRDMDSYRYVDMDHRSYNRRIHGD